MSKKSHQFYVEFLGWLECRGVRGAKYVEPVIKEMRRRQRKMSDRPPKLTIQASRKELKISQDIEDKKRRSIKKIKFPVIPGRDISYIYHAPQSSMQYEGHHNDNDDIVACIYLGYMPRTDRSVHVHVYRFDGPDTAATFYRLMSRVVDANAERINKIEIDLANNGEIDDPRLSSSDGMSEIRTTGSGASSAYSDEDPVGNFSQDDIDADLQSLADVQEFDNVRDELKFRLKTKQSPLLLPPKDYDTISRARGNLEEINKRRCLNESIVGEQGAGLDTKLSQNDRLSTESGVDLASPMSENNSGILDRDLVQPQILANRDMLNLSLTSEGFKSTSSTPGTPPTGRVLPVKVLSPPLSPRIGALRGSLIRQNSYNSTFSDTSRNSHHSDGFDGNQVTVKADIEQDISDIYAKPMKKSMNPMNVNNLSSSMNNMHVDNKQAGNINNTYFSSSHKPMVSVSPRIDYPPVDYHVEEDNVGEINMRPGSGNQRFRQPNLTRSMPPELIRSEMAMGSLNPQRNVRDMEDFQRSHSPNFLRGTGSRPGSGNSSHLLNSSWRPNSNYR